MTKEYLEVHGIRAGKKSQVFLYLYFSYGNCVPRVLSGKWTSPWGFHVNLFNFLVAHSEPKHFRVIHLPGRQNFSYVDLVGRQSYPGLPSPSHW